MNIKPKEATPGKWVAAPFTCWRCGHEDISVYPAEAERLECGRCGTFNYLVVLNDGYPEPQS